MTEWCNGCRAHHRALASTLVLRGNLFQLANMLFTAALGDKLKAAGSKVKASVAHPGVSATSLTTHLPPDIGAKAGFKFQHMADGALGIIMCAMKPDIEPVGYYGPGSDIQDPSWVGGPAKSLEFQPMCCDEGGKALLWKTSEAATEPFLEGGKSAHSSLLVLKDEGLI